MFLLSLRHLGIKLLCVVYLYFIFQVATQPVFQSSCTHSLSLVDKTFRLKTTEKEDVFILAHYFRSVSLLSLGFLASGPW